MNENSHNIILMIIIGAIIIAQFYVFWGNYRKIQDYKKTIEKTRDFNIVEVAVPEEWIKEIEVDEILRNPEAFQNISSEFSSTMTEAPVDEPNEEAAFGEQDPTLENEEFPEEIEFPDASGADEDADEEYDEDFEYEEYKNNKR